MDHQDIFNLIFKNGYIEEQVLFNTLKGDKEILKMNLDYLIKKNSVGKIKFRTQTSHGVLYYILQ